MEYTTRGDTGIEGSRICLGCMSFGPSDWRAWVLETARGSFIDNDDNMSKRLEPR